jgi:integrase
VFSSGDGRPLPLDNLRNRVWNPTLERAGLRPRTPSQTRHNYASQLLSQGADLAWVARMMGRANTRMLVLRYWKFFRNRSQPDGGRYVEALRQARERTNRENRP